MATATTEDWPATEAEQPTIEVPEVLPASIVRLFWLFARPFRVPIVFLMLASLTLRALAVLQFHAMKGIIDTAARTDLHAPGVWAVLWGPLSDFFAVVAAFMLAEWAGSSSASWSRP